MSVKRVQRVFYVSSEYVKNFIDTRISDLAVMEQHSTSYIIESLILNELLPENEEAKNIIMHQVYLDNCGGVQKTIDAIFSANALGNGWKPKHTNFKPLIEYSVNYCIPAARLTGNEPRISHFLSHFRDIVNRLDENCAKPSTESLDQKMLIIQAEWAKKLFELAQNNLAELSIRDCFQLVYDCWDILYDWLITYRFLSDLAVLGKWYDIPAARNKLYETINDISKHW